LTPESLENLIKAFASLPSIGPVAAERLAFNVLGAARKEAFALSDSIAAIPEDLVACRDCGNAGTSELCAVCSDENRDRGVLLVIERLEHLALFEKTRRYGGLYHVLGPVPKKKPGAVGMDKLLARVEGGAFREVVLALNPTKAGDAASEEIAARLRPCGAKVSRIGQGVVPGGTFGSADSGTLAESVTTRRDNVESREDEPVRETGPRNQPAGVPPALNAAVESINRLPGIGTRTAEHIVFHLVESALSGGPDAAAKGLAGAIRNVKTKLRTCRICGNAGDVDPCEICSDKSRDASQICVVASPQDALRIERTGIFGGSYHILGGLFDPLRGVDATDLNLKSLERRLKEGGVMEVIIATDPTFEGDGTALLVRDAAARQRVKTSRIGSGVLRGGDLRFTSTLQLEKALASRRPVDVSDAKGR
jgi:recombination protein RecR